MKKLLLFSLFSFLFFNNLQAQEGFRIGIQGGIPTGDFDEAVSLMVGADVGYMWVLGEYFDLGIATGYIHGFGDKFGLESEAGEDVQFLPVAGAFRFWPVRDLSIGANVGQAIGLNDGNDGGFYYRPMLGYLFNQTTEINISYTSVDLDVVTWNTISVGLVLTIQTKPDRL
ncbi:hypothetical protein [Lentiprolixibacter aurantiacus]|uniref:Outer membrane protein beta-barrel domain-containing protein n=1 Tax=Lentiprolixibacter aurantiacus TaxID=2993939 RepID=A0AAE3SNP6_9FLAO|nr:hypothetical protein [Lentiprolixibacter aurantiacus]MCX2719982.1 hypothetical protein [Lentiprolixibacter aurantiacus]